MKKQTKTRGGVFGALILAAALATQGTPMAQDALKTLAPLTVTGGEEELVKLVGSAAYLDAEEFRERGYTNLEQIVRKVPGVYVRDEDGFGNFPNISLRGVDGSRSQKMTMMEDGILSAPSPYAAPAAYYSPKVGRMSGIEFLKGSSQIKYGPHTTGGVVNYLSTPIPDSEDPRFFSRTTYGSHNTFYNHTWYGDMQETSAGNFGYILEMHSNITDGFRDIDGGGQDSGFNLFEPMLKLSFEPNTALKQRFEFKFGYTDFEADETYSGITVGDLRANPNRRYSSTQFDKHTAEQYRTYLKWTAEPSDELRFESALYFNQFQRNWAKLDGLSGTTRTNVGEALLDPAALAVLQGLGAGNIILRDAFRDHESYGWQGQANYRFATGQVEHDLAMGLRLHYDRAGGTNQTITYGSNGVGGFNPPAFGAVGRAGLGEVFATAVYLEDEIKMGALTLLPGIRYEHLEVENRTGGGAYTSSDEHLIMGGIGANYELDEQNSLFGGIYRGMSPANPGGYATGTEAEESLGFELGYRHNQDGLRGELVAFATDFKNLIAPEVGIGGGGLTPSRNGGGAEVWGLESLISYDHAERNDWGFNLPLYASFTYTNAKFANISGARLGNGAGLYAGGINGGEIPYIPEVRFACGIGYANDVWGMNLDMSFTGDNWGTGWNGRTRVNDNNTAANQTAIDGKIDSLLIFDLTGHYIVNEHIKLVGGVQNILDEQGIATRAPLGPRSNAPRMIFAGFEATF
jgi:Fe(3+) dicitrate transport protein